MTFLKSALFAGLMISGAVSAQAATFTPTFDTPAFPGTQYDVTSVENDYYAAAYGITVDNAYLYLDDRDTFDGVGIANGNVSEIGTPQSGQVNFLDTTDYVTIDYWAILDGLYSAYDSTGVLIDSFAVLGGTQGTETLSGGIISYITFYSDVGAYVTISGLTYNYDGNTDGTNDDLAPVPLPAGGLLLLGGLGAIAGLRRRKA
jgi:hypothetical protein